VIHPAATLPLVFWALAWVAACGSDSDKDRDGDGLGDPWGTATTATTWPTTTSSTSTTDVCARWTADRVDLVEGPWNGSAQSCEPGDPHPDTIEGTLRLVNLYRWMAGLPEVQTSDERNSAAQACATLMHANNDISHTPNLSWDCFSDEAAEAAGSSNLSTEGSVAAVDGYMSDWGNETTMGHRRWILSNGLGPIGVGSTGEYSCMWVLYGDASDEQDWTAFPSPGRFPVEAMDVSWVSVDETGWTIQSDRIDLTDADVEVRADGEPVEVTVVELLGGYGSDTAINLIPQGWTSQAGSTYSISVLGTDIAYDVAMVDCPN